MKKFFKEVSKMVLKAFGIAVILTIIILTIYYLLVLNQVIPGLLICG